uniref:Uncharacterized protein n=1 Tax=Acrobeloides nanus TaxID=290746 RepID=A0A914DN99_9BILA
MAVLTHVPKVVCVTQDMSWIPLVQNSSVSRLKIVDAWMGMAILMELAPSGLMIIAPSDTPAKMAPSVKFPINVVPKVNV